MNTLKSNGCDRFARCQKVLEDDSLAMDGAVANLPFTAKRAPKQCCLSEGEASAREQLQRGYTTPHVVSKNPRMSAIYELIGQLGDTATTVLIEGETGTGKEQIARAVHESAQARTGPMVAVSCAAVPETLLESELFGHEKGSFTSAAGLRKGRFELADGGTLFLDEVGDIPMMMQAKLLRVLQERCFERVGGSESIAVDVRVVAATNRRLRAMVRNGTFREDLYYRLNVIKLDVPPLRQRPEDIPLLAVHFANKFARPNQSPKSVSPECMKLLLRYGWPGNIRELENAVERGCVNSQREVLLPEDLPAEIVRQVKGTEHSSIDWSRPLADIVAEATDRIERRYLRKALRRSRGNVGRCAKLCGLSRRSLGAKLARYKIDKLEFKNDLRPGPT